MLETLQEPKAVVEADCAVLTYVLSYDDLLASATAPFLLDGPRPISIGRAGDDKPAGFRSASLLQVPDGWMSGDHAHVDRRGSDDVLIDRKSRNGTWVNGQPITERVLANGDVIEIGHSLFVYRKLTTQAATTLWQPAEARRLGPTVSYCPEVIALVRDLARIAPSAEPVLMLAETGTGKEIVAGAIHALSGREGPLQAIDCGAVPENLFESTFFGHRKGAFTGAEESRAGEIQRADGGTLFLDEVGNMSPAAQAKLLRTIETGEVTPVGADRASRVDVRWIAATNRDLFAIDDGFRQDLLRRLAGYVARIPPLRARREDLGALSAHFLEEAGVTRAAISAAAARVLYCGAFPGNIRQLRATLRCAALLAGDDPIEVEHLQQDADQIAAEAESQPIEAASAAAPPASGSPSRERLEQVLAEVNGNVTAAARLLGTHARQVYRWVEKHGIDLSSYRR